MIEDSQRIDDVETLGGKRQPEQVGPHQGNAGQLRGQLAGGHDRAAQIHADDLPVRPRRGDTQIAAHAASGIEDELSIQVRGRKPRAVEERGAVLFLADDPEPVPLQSIGCFRSVLINGRHLAFQARAAGRFDPSRELNPALEFPLGVRKPVLALLVAAGEPIVQTPIEHIPREHLSKILSSRTIFSFPC